MNIINIQEITDPDFQKAFELYQEAFPKEEQQNRSCLEYRVKSSKAQFLVAKTKKDVIAMAILYHLPDCPFCLLEYFAVHQSCRESGIGSEFLQHLVCQTQKNKKSLLAEVEDPTLGNNRAQRQKRVQFYLKSGFQQLKGMQSYVPSQNGTQATKVILLYHSQCINKKYSHKELVHLVVVLFKEVYHLPKSNALVQKIIAMIPKEYQQ